MKLAPCLDSTGRLPFRPVDASCSRKPLRRGVRCDGARGRSPAAARRWPRAGSSGSGARSAGPRGTASVEQAAVDDIVGWNWTGSDEFSPLGDRKDAPPLPLPRLKSDKRVVLVRHGQSTWNARNRIQGSSNFSVLTEQGVEQAGVAQKLLEDWRFECMFYSPLKRASQTADIVWGGRRAPTFVLPCLREIDLYSFQGLDKIESRNRYGEQYKAWQSSPADFMIDDHAPVRELWYRASLAWRDILYSKALKGCGLVVAHNAVNQALLCTAVGLPPSFFRRFSQSNAAFTVLDFEYTGAEGTQRLAMPPRVRVERVNQFPEKPLSPHKLGRSVPNRLVLVTGEATSPAVQASLNMLADNGASAPPLIGVGSAAQQALDIKMAIQAALATPGEGRTVVAVASAEACQQLLGACLGPVAPSSGQQQQQQGAAPLRDESSVGSLFQMSDGGITIVNWPSGQTKLARGTVLCTNYQLPEGA